MTLSTQEAAGWKGRGPSRSNREVIRMCPDACGLLVGPVGSPATLHASKLAICEHVHACIVRVVHEVVDGVKSAAGAGVAVCRASTGRGPLGGCKEKAAATATQAARMLAQVRSAALVCICLEPIVSHIAERTRQPFTICRLVELLLTLSKCLCLSTDMHDCNVTM